MADPLVTRPSRLRSLTSNVPTPEEQAAELALQTSTMSPVSRGFAAGGYGMTAGSFADDALSAQLDGNVLAQRQAEAEALRYANEAAQVGPRVRSLRDVGNVQDFGELAGGFLGQAGATMAPVIAGALAARANPGLIGGVAGRALPFAGASIPAYQLERGEAVLNQLADPETAGMDPTRRDELARNKGLANAALESIVPAGLVGGLGRAGVGPLRTLGRAAMDEGLTEAAQEASGILAQETLRRGSLNQALPQLGTDESQQQILDAAAAGAIGGGGMSLPTVGTQVLADVAARGVDAGRQAAKKTGQAVEETAGKTKDLRAWADETLKGFEPEDMSDDDAVADLNRRTGPGRVLPDDPTETAVTEAVNSGDISAVQRAMQLREGALPGLRQRAAQNVLDDQEAPEELRALAGRVQDGSASTEDQASLLGHVAGYQTARVSKHLAARGVVAIDEAVKFGKEQLDQIRKRDAVKENNQNVEEVRGEDQKLTEALFQRLKPEYREDRGIRTRLEPMVKLLRRLDDAEELTRESYSVIQRLAPAMDMFENADAIVPKNLRKAFKDATRAQTEAKSDTSWLGGNLTPAFQRAEPEARAALGRMIDRYALGEELDAREMGLLTRAFGSKGAAKSMLRHYRLQVPRLKRANPEALDEELRVEEGGPREDAETGEMDEDYDAAQQGFTARDGDFQYHYAGSNKKTYLNLHKKGERSPAQAKARELREQGDRAEVVSMLELAREQDLDVAAEAEKIRADFNERNERGRASLEEQVLHEGLAQDDVGLLRAHQVVRTTKRDNAEDKLLQAHKLKAQKLVKQASNPNATREQRDAARSTLFTVRRSDGPDMTLSAESLWKDYGDRVQSEKKDRGISTGEGTVDALRAQDLFAQALSELALDPEVHGIDLPEGLVLDRKTGTTLQRDERMETEPFYNKPKGEFDAAVTKALSDKDFAGRLKAIANTATRETTEEEQKHSRLKLAPISVDDRLDALAQIAFPEEQAEKDSPRAAYLRKRASMAKAEMKNLVDKLVPPPRDQEAKSTGKMEVEDFSEANVRAYQEQQQYVSDLEDLIGHRGDMSEMLASARTELERLEEKAYPAREYDETTGQPTKPSTKEAAYNASGVKEMARRAQKDMDAGAPDGIAIPTPTKIDSKEEKRLPVRSTKHTGREPSDLQLQPKPEKAVGVATPLGPEVTRRKERDARMEKRRRAALRRLRGKGEGPIVEDAPINDTVDIGPVDSKPQTYKKGDTFTVVLADGRTADVRVAAVIDFAGQQLIVHRRPVFDYSDAQQNGTPTADRGGLFVVTEPQTMLTVNPQAEPVMKHVIEATKARMENLGEQALKDAIARHLGTKNNDMDEFDTLHNNGSGESSASTEAINRYRDEQEAGQVRMLIDRDGNVRRLFGVDAVDTWARQGQIIVQRGVGKNEWTVISADPQISKDLLAGRVNAAKTELNDWASYNQQTRKSSGIGISRAFKNEIYEEIKRITGLKNTSKSQHLFFVKAKEIGGASGQYNPAQRAIKVAISSVDPLGVAYHEALHDFVAGLQESEEGRALRKALFKAGEMPHIRAQLKELLKDHPKALAAIETDPEERIAYLFQFWAVGKHLGKDLVKINDKATLNALQKLAQWIRELLGVLSSSQQAEKVLEALYDGRFADRNTVGAVIQDMHLDTLQDKAKRLAGPLADVYDKLMLTATDRLRNFGVEPLDDLADMFATEPGTEKGSLRFLQRRAQVSAQYLNRVSKLFEDSTAEQRSVALRNLQSMQAPSSPLEQQVRDLLDELHAYMHDNGVRRYNEKTKRWVALPKVENYFPRRWDPRKIMANDAKFKALLAQHGNVQLDQQNKIVDAIVHGDGQIELADQQYHVGYTPFARHVQDRQLTFINESNAKDFAEFQNNDLPDVLKGYIFQAVHRAEFAKDFGNAGEAIDERIQAAAKHLDGKQVAEATNTVKALVGTLGADVNPRMKDVMSAAVTAQNVILLPLTMFSQFIDALGVGLRAQAPEEAWNAFKRGMADFTKAVRGKKVDDYDAEMAKTLGLIDEENMLEAMGQAHAGAFMSKFARDVNRKFFRWNGMESWNRSMRITAMVAGERFIIREQDNDRYMRELGLTKDDVMVKPDGRLAVTAEQMMALGASRKTAETREAKVQQALFRFVDGAVLRPNSAQRPVWGSDPHWMLVFHLKQFAFAFQKTILARVNNEYEHGQMMPAAILAAYVPVTMASGLAKAMLTGQPIGDGSMLDLLNYGVMRSGILGSQSFSADAFSDLERGLLPGSSLIGPTMEHAWMASRWVVGDPEIDAGRVLDRSLPFARYF